MRHARPGFPATALGTLQETPGKTMTDQSHRLCWDDLRIVRAIGETGALASAAITLGVNNSTIARRLSKTEGLLGVTLFVRRRSGYVPTSAGAELIALAGQMELDVVSVTRRVSGHLQEQVGELRVTTTDSLLLHFLMPIIASFKERNPAVSIEVIVGKALLQIFLMAATRLSCASITRVWRRSSARALPQLQ